MWTEGVLLVLTHCHMCRDCVWINKNSDVTGVGVSLKSKHETSRWFVSKNWNFNIPCFWIFEHHFPNDLILCLTAVSLFHDLCCTTKPSFFYHFYLSLKFGCLKAGDHSFLAGKIDVSFQTHIRFLPISPSKCLVKSCLMKATSEFSILTLRSSNNGNNLLQKFRGFYGKIIQHQRGISTKTTSPSLRTPDGTRPGKRLHHELERSTMRKS